MLITNTSREKIAKFKYKSLLATLITFASFGSLAAESNAGTIHFTGEIIEPSCVIVGDSGTDYTVPLGTYPKSLFNDAGVGKESDLVPVIISLASCPTRSDGLPAIQLTFDGSIVAGNSTLLSVSKITTSGETAATGIGIAFSEVGENMPLIRFNEESQVYVQLPATAGDTITASFNARYKSFLAAVTAGPADADLTINILYR
jgi:type 1 fimbrial protein